jgi:hypothetical protein
MVFNIRRCVMGFEITKITRNYKKLQKVVISKSDEK